MLSEILDWHDSRELEISHSKPGSEWNAKSWIFCWWKGRSRKVKDSCWHVAMKHYCQTKLCRWCDSPPSPPNGGHPKYYVAIMNEQSITLVWLLLKFATREVCRIQFGISYSIHDPPLHSDPPSRKRVQVHLHLLSFQMEYGMSLGRWIVCRDDNSSHHPTTTIEMPIILQKNFWRSMPMGDGTVLVTYLVVPELYRNTLNHPQTKSTTTDYEMWKSSAGQHLLFVFIPQF